MLPYFDKGNFEDLMNIHNKSKEPISEESIKCWLGQSIKIFQYLASKNVVHRCVRPSNFMLDEHHNVYVVDICSEIVEKDIRRRTRGKTVHSPIPEFSGCLTFAAPEIVVRNSSHDTASDFWSLGGVFLGLMTCHKKTCEEYGSYLIEFKKVMQDDLLREIIEEEARKEEIILNGVLVPLDLNQPFEYYTRYMLRHYKSRSFFAFDSNSLCDFLVYLVHHLGSLEICEIGMKVIGVQVYGCRCQNMSQTLNDLKCSEILMHMLDNFAGDLPIITLVLQSMWPMLIFDANVQDFYEQGACSKVASIIKMHYDQAEVFEAASMVVFGLSLSGSLI
ncbi:hypothetical protein HELRODRAFT_165681 [Helobdella robusta]|uniref:Protein kinase domain-containing protein n=1 Tax=Helobdella robusta TaxID=6412 RepID=T1EX59_HELRO|nr:hypothetical protein HELRODRAFT_165681 [Helobdella robusta]ESN91627.1 hypothetical protein HELRODRAFT_165681 [Helobdella robusta]